METYCPQQRNKTEDGKNILKQSSNMQPEPTGAISVKDQPIFELEINCNGTTAAEITKAINSL